MVRVTVEARNNVDFLDVVKLQCEAWELNVRATTDELWKLADIEKTDWVQGRVLQVGTSANAPVWLTGTALTPVIETPAMTRKAVVLTVRGLSDPASTPAT